MGHGVAGHSGCLAGFPDVYIGMDDAGETSRPGSGGCYFLTGRIPKQQSGHNEFKVKETVRARFFAIVNRTEASSL